ncbi:MAG: HAD hydrolase-like protein [Gemmatimonadetes bacterium]|nr:HAD hydrolase-like protein [Gemmatimonadota bacterium]
MAERDWWWTARQSLPQVASVLRHLRPTFSLGDLSELDPGFCADHGVRGLIWDVDGTLTSYHGSQVQPGIREAVNALFGAASLRHVILSNSGDARFEELGRIFPMIPVLKAYRVEEGLVRRRLFAGDEAWSGAARREGMKPIRKPSRDLIGFALEELRVPAGEALMVGDQHWTDVAGAGMAGVRSAKLPTLDQRTFPRTLRVLQRVEALASRVLPGRPARV